MIAFRTVYPEREYNNLALEQKHKYDQSLNFMRSNKIDIKRMLSLRELRK